MHDSTDLGDASDAVRSSVENLRELAEATGGSAYFPLVLDELEAIYSEIATELESQYSVSYYPTNQNWDGESSNQNQYFGCTSAPAKTSEKESIK